MQHRFYPAILSADKDLTRLGSQDSVLMRGAQDEAANEIMMRHLRGEPWDPTCSLVVVRVYDDMLVQCYNYPQGVWEMM